MKFAFPFWHRVWPIAIAAVFLLSPSLGFSQEFEDDDEEDTEESVSAATKLDRVVVTGTRKYGLAPTETLSPIDLMDSEELLKQANFDLTDNFTRIAPSFNTQRFPIADGTSFVRPVTLRNLSPDHTLVLINGTRRHRSAMVNLQLAPLGTVNQGAQGVDFSTIPMAAVDRIEVLRDGASAQYGSDAIAGVVNIILKEDAEGGMASAQVGEYFEGDGFRTMFTANKGFALGDAGFINATIEHATSDSTSRGVPRPDAAFVASVVGVDQTPLNGYGQRWGDPEVEATKLFVNAGLPVGDGVNLYANASYAQNETISDFFYRGPVLDPQYEFAARNTLQQDLDGDFLPDPAPQSLIDEITAAGLDPANYLVPDSGSASGYVLRNPIYTLFPGGYNPDFGADITDFAFVVGADGESAGGWFWDVRARIAENEVDYVLSETINPSLGSLSPTSFRPGTLTQEESSAHFDVVKPMEFEALAAPLNVAFGLEFRNETYKIGAGDPASRAVGPTAAVFGLGSDGFQGFPVESATRFKSDSYAAYVDLETNVTDRLSGGVALRFEDYDTFGSTFDWKIAGRFDFTEQFALRGTANTGFRAPTPGQINTLNVTTTADASGNLIPSGTYPVNNPIAIALGAQPLAPEESTNFTLGVVYQPLDNTSITIDYYDIEIRDRLALRNINIGPDEVAALDAAGIPNADLLNGSLANYFTNAFDSNVSGVDVSITSNFDLGQNRLLVDLRHNYNEHEVVEVAPDTINASRVFDLENQVPSNRSTLSFTYQTPKLFTGLLRLNQIGAWETTGGLFSPGDASDATKYDGALLVDIEATFTFADNYNLTIGGENIFDTYPDDEQDPVLQFLGVKYALTSPYGFNGAFWYARFSAQF